MVKHDMIKSYLGHKVIKTDQNLPRRLFMYLVNMNVVIETYISNSTCLKLKIYTFKQIEYSHHGMPESK